MQKTSKFRGICAGCGNQFPPMTLIEWNPSTHLAYHTRCVPEHAKSTIDQRATLDMIKPAASISNISSPDIKAIDRLQILVESLATTVSAGMSKLTSQARDHESRLNSLLQQVWELKSRPQKVIGIELKSNGISKTLIGTYHYRFPLLLKTMQALHVGYRNIWIPGPAGGGKTTAAEQASRMLGLTFSESSIKDGNTEPETRENFECQGAVSSPY